MALQVDYTLDSGVDLASSYHRVTALYINIENGYGYVLINIYKDKTSRDNNLEPVKRVKKDFGSTDFNSFLTATDVDPANINHVSQGYAYLKTLPEYANATDV